MKLKINQIEKLPPIYSQHKNITQDKKNEYQSIEKRNAVINEFLNNLDKKLQNLNKSENNENDIEEDDDIDDLFNNAKILKKEENIINKKINRPKNTGRKISPLLLSNKNELNDNKCSTLSSENDSFLYNKDKTDKTKDFNSINNKDILNINEYDNKFKKHRKLPKIKYLKLRNFNITNHFLTSIKTHFTNKEKNSNNNTINNNSKWENINKLNNENSFLPKDSTPFHHINIFNSIRSKSHIGNRTQKNTLKNLKKGIYNYSSNYIAAELYKNNSLFPKGLKRNYTAKLNNTIRANEIFSSNEANKKDFKTINNSNNKKKFSKKNKSMRKIFNYRNNNCFYNWVNTGITKENTIINNINLSKKQLKIKLNELESVYKLKNDPNKQVKTKKYI